MKKNKKRRKKQEPENQNQQPFFIAKKEKEPDQAKPFFQAKMEIDGPEHPAEKEADLVADQVVQNSQQNISRKGEEEEAQTKIQRQEEEEAQAKIQRQEEEEESMQLKVQREEEEEAMQAKIQRQEEEEAQTKLQRQEEEEAQAKADGTPVMKQQTQSGIKQEKGKGQALPEKHLKEMNQAFGTDFKDVRIHKDSKAQELSESIHAQAFTTGKDVFFNTDKFNPDTPEGKHLLAHELTHVVQQTKKKPKP